VRNLMRTSSVAWPMLGLSCLLVLGCGDDEGSPSSPTAPTATDSAPTSSACVVGQVLRPGDSCTVGSDRFEVLSDGRGRYGCCITAGTGVNINGFVANRISGTNNWRVEQVP